MRTALLALLPSLLLSGCAKDVVLPDTTSQGFCGDGILQPGEQCDVVSPGCLECQIVPTWTCDASGCEPICGDGVVSTGTTSRCESPRRIAECDMSGYWAIRETDYTRDAVVNDVQTASEWFLYHFVQSGGAFTVVEDLECGVLVSGSATVEYAPGTLRGLMYLNRSDGQGGRPARQGIAVPQGAGCAVSFDRWYKIRGGVDSLLPGDFSIKPPLDSLPALPFEPDPVNGTDWPTGATDPDGDGIPGEAYLVTGVVSGVRNVVERDWKEYATLPASPAVSGAVTFDVPGSYDYQGNVLRVTGCGAGCPLLASGAHAAPDVQPRITFSFIGSALGGPRVSQVVQGVPRADLDTDLTTCANVRLLLPHDASVP
jgi:hypothetical protein